MTSLQKHVSDALRVDALDKPAETSASTGAEPPATSSEAVTTPTTPEAPTPETFVEAEAHAAVKEPLAITREQAQVAQGSVTQDSVTQDTAPAEAIKDAKAS